MGEVNIQVKIMPSSPSADLEKIKEEARKIIEKAGGKGCLFHEEPIAFGLKAIIITFTYSEEKETETMEMRLGKMKNISSAGIIDMRRAL